MANVHPRATAGFQDAVSYDKFRVQYIAESVEKVLSVSGIPGGCRKDGVAPSDALLYDVLELGAGTGMFSGELNARLSDDIRYLATDPLDSFMSSFQQKYPKIKALNCTASNIPLPDQSVGAVVVAHAFHWFATENALREIARVLVDGGTLVMLWNVKDVKAHDWLRNVEGYLLSFYLEQGVPMQQSNEWQQVFEDTNLFQSLNVHVLPAAVSRGTHEETLGHYKTRSFIQSSDPKTREQILQTIAAMFPEGELTIPYVCEIYWCQKMNTSGTA